MRTLPTAGLLCALTLVAVSCAGSAPDADGPFPTIGADLSGAATIPDGLVAERADEIDAIVMIGDSITVASTQALDRQFDAIGFDDVDIVAMEGKRMALSLLGNPSGAEVARFIAGANGDASDGRLWVVALGSNDINQYRSPDEVAGAVNDVLAEVPDDVPLVWVDTYYRDEAEGATMLNTVVADRLSRRGNAVMAPWSLFAPGEGVLRSDGVHPSTEGTEAFAGVVVSSVQQFLDR